MAGTSKEKEQIVGARGFEPPTPRSRSNEEPAEGTQATVNTSDVSAVSPVLASPRGLLANVVANVPDPIDADLEARIVAAELDGRKTVANALAKRLDTHRAARAGANVIDLATHRRSG